ncbi:MAG TPA: iron-sulfur cluster assembly protein IscA [Steroidobacteraceae bacterium]|jgi:iron-sulfur cluster assembly protein|nr:iron-sulfur cluster assembly protein IscA [Steroidobacteraceae bacterium]
MAISLTESAAERVRSHLARRGGGLGLRLAVKATGCSGLSYVVDYADEAGPDDLVFDSRGVKVFVDRASLTAIDGTRIDFVRQGLNESFRFENPNVRGECGCGESFTV